MLKKMLADNASLCHESAILAASAFAQHAPADAVSAAASDMAGPLVEKHAAGKQQAKAIDALVALFKAGATDAVERALLGGAKHKVPKTCAAAAKTLVAVMRASGGVGLELKAVTGLVVGLIEHRDKSVRDEGMALLGELRAARGDGFMKVRACERASSRAALRRCCALRPACSCSAPR